MGVSVSVISFILFQVFPRQIISLFGDGSELYYQFGVQYFKVFLFFAFLNALQPITGIFLSLTRQIIFFLPCLVIYPMYMGIEGILYVGPTADLMAALVAMGMVLFEFKNIKKLEMQNQ